MGEADHSKAPKLRLAPTGKANGITVAISLGFLIAAIAYPKFSAYGQHYGQPPMPVIPVMPVMQQPSMPTFNPVTLPPGIIKPPVVVPTDVTNPQLTNPTATRNFQLANQNNLNAQTALALAGIQLLNDNSFPNEHDVGKNYDWIIVLAKAGAEYTRTNGYTIDFKSGEIVVSVKSPSRLAFVNTPYGDIAVGANSDVMITFNHGILRVLNFDGEGKVLKIKLYKGPFAGPADPTVTIAPAYELIASDRIITRAEMRPKDGIARRFGKSLEKGHMAISEFSLTSAANTVGMLVNLQQTTTGIKERRIVTDLSKMAAIINYRNGDHGDQGYSVEK